MIDRQSERWTRTPTGWHANCKTNVGWYGMLIEWSKRGDRRCIGRRNGWWSDWLMIKHHANGLVDGQTDRWTNETMHQ
jgi:hypothetical protein